MGHKHPIRSVMMAIGMAMLLLLIVPALAQEITAEPLPIPTGEVAPVTIVNAGENGDVIVNQPDAAETPQSPDLSARDLLFSLVAVIVSLLLYRSVPADKVEDLWKKAEAHAKETPGTLDDDAVAIGKMLSEYLSKKKTASAGPPNLPISGAATSTPHSGS
jgi:hypothetical protein